jgi:hypothetical protein
MNRLLSVIGHIMRELSSIIMALLIIAFFYWNTGYQPVPEEAVSVSFMAAMLLFLYLWIQSGGIALTGVPNSLAMATDALFSIIPIIPLLFSFFDYYRGNLELSSFQVWFGYTAIVAILFDIVVNMTLMIRLSRRYLGEMGAVE